MPPNSHPGERLRRPSPDLTPLGAPALRAYAPRSGPSAPPSSPEPEILHPPLGAPTLSKSWLRPWLLLLGWEFGRAKPDLAPPPLFML